MLVLANYSIEAEAKGKKWRREGKGFRDLTLFGIWKYMERERECTRKQVSRR